MNIDSKDSYRALYVSRVGAHGNRANLEQVKSLNLNPLYIFIRGQMHGANTMIQTNHDHRRTMPSMVMI